MKTSKPSFWETESLTKTFLLVMFLIAFLMMMIMGGGS
ncbi:hypothetical protein L8106_04141 [Lyngbya sp. PCC 8106]|uniref:Putative membrane protein n=1 Tax=Lyngbya aestuarii BL J TaxID=1348334 RepID=U7QHJ6_9CYAN|nr:hypothetical protein L8106_04141 [Lyngbya sp. PCC 8106]ERT06550.1 putative membrane protein [Lyngbya aestuarii BL J]